MHPPSVVAMLRVILQLDRASLLTVLITPPLAAEQPVNMQLVIPTMYALSTVTAPPFAPDATPFVKARPINPTAAVEPALMPNIRLVPPPFKVTEPPPSTARDFVIEICPLASVIESTPEAN